MVMDVRFLPNPHWVDELRPQTGQHPAVRDYVLSQPGAMEFLQTYHQLLDLVVDGYSREGKRYMTVAIGVHGGKHRSVAITEALAASLDKNQQLSVRGCTAIWVANDARDREQRSGRRGPTRIVALGGGHGLYATLSAARRLTPHVTAVVTVADDGGSSGRLRSELGVVPPGDLRMALAALASDSPHGRLWATIIQHRFGGSGALAGHPIGNLLLAGITELLADPVAALDELGRILGIHGRVLPMCPIALQIEADVAGLESDPRMSRVISGQVAVATTPGKVRRCGCCRETRRPPGRPSTPSWPPTWWCSARSWFTSVIPHVLVPGLAAALRSTTARRALVLNLAAEPGETAGFSAERHLHVLAQHAPDFTVHDIIVDAARVPSDREREQLRRTASLLEASVQFADVSRPGTPLHDPAKLAAALDGVRVGDRFPATEPSACGTHADHGLATGGGVPGPTGDAKR